MDYIEKLNNEQKKAATFKDGPCLVIAGAGSGKTKVLTTRIANLIENGVKPYNILAITFTNKAAGEMRERVNNIINAHDAFIGTFHSFGLKRIRENSALFNLTSAFTLIDTEDQTSIIKKIMKDINITDKMISPAFIKSKISFIKNNMLSDSEKVPLRLPFLAVCRLRNGCGTDPTFLFCKCHKENPHRNAPA